VDRSEWRRRPASYANRASRGDQEAQTLGFY
jgi:hypothetical protein